MASRRPPCAHAAVELPLLAGERPRCHACGERLPLQACPCLTPPRPEPELPEVKPLTLEERASLMAAAYASLVGDRPRTSAAAILGPRRRW